MLHIRHWWLCWMVGMLFMVRSGQTKIQYTWDEVRKFVLVKLVRSHLKWWEQPNFYIFSTISGYIPILDQCDVQITSNFSIFFGRMIDEPSVRQLPHKCNKMDSWCNCVSFSFFIFSVNDWKNEDKIATKILLKLAFESDSDSDSISHSHNCVWNNLMKLMNRKMRNGNIGETDALLTTKQSNSSLNIKNSRRDQSTFVWNEAFTSKFMCNLNYCFLSISIPISIAYKRSKVQYFSLNSLSSPSFSENWPTIFLLFFPKPNTMLVKLKFKNSLNRNTVRAWKGKWIVSFLQLSHSRYACWILYSWRNKKQKKKPKLICIWNDELFALWCNESADSPPNSWNWFIVSYLCDWMDIG